MVRTTRWERKLQLVTAEIARLDVGNISGDAQLDDAGATSSATLHRGKYAKESMATFGVFFHGGIAFAPYRSEYEQLLGEGVNYQENLQCLGGLFWHSK